MKTLHILGIAVGACGLTALTGCGGPDLGGTNRSSSFDQGLTGNYSGYGNNGTRGGSPVTGAAGRGTYAKIETSFELPDVKGNPFDYTENDVMVTVQRPDNHTAKVPAFFDGGAANKTWRVRYTPDTTGKYSFTRFTLNGKDVQPEKIEKRETEVTGSPTPGFVRRDGKDKTRFAFDNGSSYYPLGHNVAFADKADDIPPVFEKMSKAGENWSRVWMSHMDGLNLDWTKSKSVPGQLDLEAAKRWDTILDAAEKDSIYVQLVLQHHGQVSTRVDANWDANPWNKKNGGFLSSADEFFSNPRAIALTKAKYRYLIARYGYSPNILAWELFNEVEWSDAIFHKHPDEVATWHNEMATFLRQQDPYRHLITSSAGLAVAALGKELDYWQPHGYAPDPVSAIASLDTRKLDRPVFFGEIGPGEGVKEDENWLRGMLWAGVMSDHAGTPQFWSWKAVEKDKLYDRFKAVADFLKQSGLTSKRGLTSSLPTIETPDRATLAISPGSGWGQAKQTDFAILPSGAVEGLGSMPSYLQGSANRSLFPSATFKTTYAASGTFVVTVGQSAKAGSTLQIFVDGTKAAEKTFKAADKDNEVGEQVEAKVAMGDHTIRIENPGADWLTIRKINLTPYAPAIGAVGKASKDYAAYWLYNRGAKGEAKAKITVPGLQSGSYKVTWWDTNTGKQVSEDTASATSAGLALNSPGIEHDLALTVAKAGEKTASKSPKEKPTKSTQGTSLH